MPVILNRYKGNHFETGTCCDICKKQASVYIFQQYHNILPAVDMFAVCFNCLVTAQKELNNAVVKDAAGVCEV